MKTGSIDPELKSKIDGIQGVIDNYWDCIIDTLDNPYAHDVREFFRNRIDSLVSEKLELIKQVGVTMVDI